MTTKTKQTAIIRYNQLLDQLFAASTITETNRIQGEMGDIFWAVHKAGYHFAWGSDNRVSDIVPYSE